MRRFKRSGQFEEHELPILDYCRRIESKQLVFVNLGKRNVWARVPEYGLRRFLRKVKYMQAGTAQTIIPSVTICRLKTARGT